MANENKQKTVAEVEAARRRKEEQARRNRRRNRQLIGVALAILIVVGAISIVRSGIGLARTLMDNAPEREEYTQRVTTMVWFDVLPFDDLSQIDPNTVRQIAIWGAFNQIGSDNVEHDEIGASIIPLPEVNRYIGELFGTAYLDSMPPAATFTDASQGLTYTYDEARSAYIVPATGLQPLYLPTVVDINNEGNGQKRVTVGYVSTGSATGTVVATPDFEHPVRYMDYIFQRDGNVYYLVALHRNTTIEVVLPEGVSLPQSIPAENPDSSSTAGGEELLPPSSLAGTGSQAESSASSPAEPPESTSASASGA